MAKSCRADRSVDARRGIERIYGVVGDALNPLTDAIRRNGKLRWIAVRHEEVAAFAAGADAQMTGRPLRAPAPAAQAACT